MRLFASVLSRIPADVPAVESVRQVSLRRVGSLPGLVGLTRWSDRRRHFAEADHDGRQTITFYSSLLEHLSDLAYTAVIAHELAHAWLNEHVGPLESPKREAEADQLIVEWGFANELAQLQRETETIGGSVY